MHTAPQVKLSPLIESVGGIARSTRSSAPMMEHEQQLERIKAGYEKKEHDIKKEDMEFERAIEDIERDMDREEKKEEKAVEKEKRLRKKYAEKEKAKKNKK